MNLLEEFCRQIKLDAWSSDFNDMDISFTSNNSDFNVVDGEEGDHGEIRYYTNTGMVAKKTVFGGDSEETEFTKYGAELLTPIAMALFRKNIERLELID